MRMMSEVGPARAAFGPGLDGFFPALNDLSGRPGASGRGGI